MTAASTDARERARAQLESHYEDAPLAPTVVVPAARRFGKRFAIAALVAVVLIAGAIAVAQRAVDDRVGELKTVAVPKDALGTGEVGHGPVNILVVGSDHRDFRNVRAFGSPADTGLPRSDTMFLLHIDGTSIQGLLLPRDLLVTTADGSTGLLNATFNQGPAALIDAIKANFGITIDHYVEVGFESFPKVVDAVGGVSVYSPGVVRDSESGLSLTGPGCRALDGASALAWVRSRHLEILQDGTWRDASPRADLDREARQQEFVRALARRAKAETGGDPAAAVRLADAIIPALTIDSSFSKDEILGLVRALVHTDPDSLQLATLPVEPAADQAHLIPEQPEAAAALAPFRGDASPTTTLPAPSANEATTTTLSPPAVGEATTTTLSPSAVGEATTTTLPVRSAGEATTTTRSPSAVGEATTTTAPPRPAGC
jgi:LCP family protein required for cell wall assembly